jgi:hypothetical protein
MASPNREHDRQEQLYSIWKRSSERAQKRRKDKTQLESLAFYLFSAKTDLSGVFPTKHVDAS